MQYTGEPYTDPRGRTWHTGLIPSTASQRRAFCDRHVGATIPRTDWRPVDYRAFAPAVYDQGQQGSCVGHGGVASLATLRAMHGLGTDRLSACNLYGQINGGKDQGAMVVDALKALQSVGACLESTVGPTHWQPSGWPANWKAEAGRFKIEKATEIQGFDEIGTALMEGDPVCFGIPLGKNFDAGPDGVVPDWNGQEAGGHCMFAIGLAQIQGRWRLLVQNSWAARWGMGGYCYLPESYFTGWHEAYRLKAGIDDPQGDNPPKLASAFVRITRREGESCFGL
jgi:hypothetical protein